MKVKSFFSFVLLAASITASLATCTYGSIDTTIEDLVLGSEAHYKEALKGWEQAKLIELHEALGCTLTVLRGWEWTGLNRIDKAYGLERRNMYFPNEFFKTSVQAEAIVAACSCAVALCGGLTIASIASYRALKNQLNKRGYGNRLPTLHKGKIDKITTRTTLGAGALCGLSILALYLDINIRTYKKETAIKTVKQRLLDIVQHIRTLKTT
ncbi:TPA: hypothetical protein DDZ86_02635 [Candidatus Dependentiae bacterium]|nr:MAG: hypothetical protein UW09_C0001G0122 [candidate division TM6 bacterium GW2011_GWF2_43_87]HBL98515.1 hypothetical protein [Candidatus Dependentiae bacterium]